MKLPHGLLVSRFLAGVTLLIAGEIGITTRAIATDNVEWIRGGGFEQGYGDFEVYRYPRFSRDNASTPASRVELGALSGRYSLLLPGMDAGGYRFVFPQYDLAADSAYRLNFRIWSPASVRVQAELFHGTDNISRQALRLQSGDSRAEFLLPTTNGSIGRIDQFANEYRVVLRIMPEADMVIDDISLAGPGRASTKAGPWVELIPDSLSGIYGIGGTGMMRVSADVDIPLTYRITDVVRGIHLTGNGTRPVGQNGIIDLITDKRGAYLVEIDAGDSDGKEQELASRRYIVIDREHTEPSAARYGIAMEEHGQKTHVDARIQAVDLYRLAAELGAGSVRIFTLAMPDIVSADGIHYDFFQIDRALELCRWYGLDPLLELGSNLPNRIPAWLRTSESRPDTIDLTSGLATKELRDRLARSGGGKYLDLVAYERYLRRVFGHLGGRVRYFEIWNEPGHKFLPEDYLKIARLTRKVQRELAPTAELVGYSSTKLPWKANRWSINNTLPGFLEAMLSMDSGSSIDVLSYHSAHAFKFLEEGQYDHEGSDETGYVDLLRMALARKGVKRNLPIWDTERGVLWASDRAVTHGSETDFLEVARRLPGIYAAGMASGVERLFWFFMDSSTSTIAKLIPRYGFFDANLEPMPQLAVYDAMTSLIGNARFDRRVERDDGLQIYFFENQEDTILMAFNWRKQESSFKLEFSGAGYQWLDVMGNGVMAEDGAVLHTRKEIKVAGWPSYFLYPGLRAAQVRVPEFGH